MKFFLPLTLPVLCVSFLFQSCETTAGGKSTAPQDSLWNNRIGNYTYGQAVSEYGQPQSRKDIGSNLTEMVWEQNELYDSSKSGPQTLTVDKFGQAKPDTQTGVIGFKTRKLTLLFDKEGKLRSWRQK
jgi:hypothetical protein